jgi:hypothetical protein
MVDCYLKGKNVFYKGLVNKKIPQNPKKCYISGGFGGICTDRVRGRGL